MDSASFFNSIKNIASSLHCPSCGGGYTLGEIKLHSQNSDGLVFVANCKKCSLPVWINVLAQSLVTEGESIIGPIETDDIINFHLEVKEFDGDFRRVFS